MKKQETDTTKNVSSQIKPNQYVWTFLSQRILNECEVVIKANDDTSAFRMYTARNLNSSIANMAASIIVDKNDIKYIKQRNKIICKTLDAYDFVQLETNLQTLIREAYKKLGDKLILNKINSDDKYLVAFNNTKAIYQSLQVMCNIILPNKGHKINSIEEFNNLCDLSNLDSIIYSHGIDDDLNN
jgi:hypothetical protein